MRTRLKLGVYATIGWFVLSSCGRKDKNDNSDGDSADGVDATDSKGDTEQNSGTSGGSDSDVASGCTGEENTASLLNATHLTLSKLPTLKQTSILLTQSRLPGERSLELSTGAHVTNKMNLTADIAEEFVRAWKDAAADGHADIVAAYGTYPAGDRLSYVLFGNSFYLQLVGGAPDPQAVAAIGEMMDALDLATTNPANNNAAVPPVNDDGRIVAIVAAIGTSMCMN